MMHLPTVYFLRIFRAFTSTRFTRTRIVINLIEFGHARHTRSPFRSTGKGAEWSTDRRVETKKHEKAEVAAE